MFEYDEPFHEAHREDPGGIAVHLPYAQRRFETGGVNLHPYFAGVLPEGLRLTALVRRAKTSEDDLFTLLALTGADCVGDVFAAPEGQTPQGGAPAAEVRALSEVSFRDLFERSVRGDPSAEPVVPGVQEKVSASMSSFPVALVAKLEPQLADLGEIGLEPKKTGFLETTMKKRLSQLG